MSARRIVAGSLLAAASLVVHGGEPGLKSPPGPQERCDAARDADFVGDGRRRLEEYLEWLARTSGEPYGIRPREFHLLVSNAAPRTVAGQSVGGEIGCSWGQRYISLYKQSLTRRALAETYNTIAREFYHHLQVRRDGVACDSSIEDLAALEAEARDWALKVAPLCR